MKNELFHTNYNTNTIFRPTIIFSLWGSVNNWYIVCLSNSYLKHILSIHNNNNAFSISTYVLVLLQYTYRNILTNQITDLTLQHAFQSIFRKDISPSSTKGFKQLKLLIPVFKFGISTYKTKLLMTKTFKSQILIKGYIEC